MAQAIQRLQPMSLQEQKQKVGMGGSAGSGDFFAVFSSVYRHTPEPVLASIVIYAVSGYLRFAPFKQYFIWRKDRLLSIIAIWAVIIFGVLNGLLIAVIVSVLILLKSYSVPRIAWLGRLNGGHDSVDMNRFP